MIKEIIKFVSCRLLTLGLEVVLMVIFVSLLHINDMISKINTLNNNKIKLTGLIQ